MSASNWPRDRGSDGRVADVRFVEVELPAAVAPRLVIEMESGLRLLLADSGDVGLAADLIAHLRGRR